jgi:hypothetical protein
MFNKPASECGTARPWSLICEVFDILIYFVASFVKSREAAGFSVSEKVQTQIGLPKVVIIKLPVFQSKFRNTLGRTGDCSEPQVLFYKLVPRNLNSDFEIKNLSASRTFTFLKSEPILVLTLEFR